MHKEPADTYEQSALISELQLFCNRRPFIFQCFTFLMSSRNAALSPLNLTPCGPERLRLASTRSSLSEDRHLAKTASPKTNRWEERGERGGRGRETHRNTDDHKHEHDSAVFVFFFMTKAACNRSDLSNAIILS